MSSLCLLLLLLLPQYTPPAQALPFLERKYLSQIREMKALLDQPPLPSHDPLNANERFILRNKAFVQSNLAEFLNAAKDFQEKGDKIRKILEEFRTVLPTPMTTEDPISIEKGDWDDFKRKLKEYLNLLIRFIII